MTSFDDDEEEKISNPFNESFGEDNTLPTLTREHMTEEKTHQQEDDNKNNNIKDNLFTLINQGVKEGTEQVISMLNKGNQKEPIIEEIKSSNDKLDEIINETKKKVNKPLPMNKLPQINAFNTDGMTESEKRLRRDTKIY